jgi:beta-glucosidase-like glycosyl hydrolase
MVAELLEAGTDVNLATQGDRTALMIAVESQDWHEASIDESIKSIALLAQAGANLEQESEGMTALAL